MSEAKTLISKDSIHVKGNNQILKSHIELSLSSICHPITPKKCSTLIFIKKLNVSTFILFFRWIYLGTKNV
jgi:hypothetical protein